jgi:hypothetical protein
MQPSLVLQRLCNRSQFTPQLSDLERMFHSGFAFR